MNIKCSERPKLSVCVVTYNHEKYIRQCLESIVEQEVDFDFEIIVGEDCSTDSTREIVKEFCKRYPAKFRLLLHSKNVGATQNYVATHALANGEYVAHIDGDDFALPGKLATFVSALDKNPNVNIAWHRMKIMDAKSGSMVDDLIDISLQPKGGFLREDLLACGSVGAHSGSVYRSDITRALNLSHREMLDFYIMVERLGTGRAMWIDGFYGVYRRDVGIMAAGGGAQKKLFSRHLAHFLARFPQCRKQINSLAFLLLLADIRNLRRPITLNLWFKSFHPLFLIEFAKRWPLYRILRLP